MSPILFYGVPSGCSFGSIVALEWLGAPYRLCRIEMPEVVSGEAYRQINPVGETPSLLTADGEILSESMAILNHIAARGIDAGLGFPQGSAGFDRLNRMLAWLNTTFFNAYSPLWYALEHGRGDGARALRDYGHALVAKAHADLEMLIGDQAWLLGSRRSLADAYFAGIARWNEYHDAVDRRAYPNLQRLLDKLQADPAVRFAHAIEDREPAHSEGGYIGDIGLEQALGVLRQSA